jgi:hypothetical protein
VSQFPVRFYAVAHAFLTEPNFRRVPAGDPNPPRPRTLETAHHGTGADRSLRETGLAQRTPAWLKVSAGGLGSNQRPLACEVMLCQAQNGTKAPEIGRKDARQASVQFVLICGRFGAVLTLRRRSRG